MQAPADGVAHVGMVAFAAHGLRGGVQVGRHQLETGERKPESEACGGKPDALAARLERVAVEGGLIKRVEPGSPQEEVGELQVASENHPRDGKRKNDKVGEASVADNLPDGEERERGDGENHHLSVVAAVDVGEVFRREGVEEPEEGGPPAVAREVPGQKHGAHEGDPHGEDELEAHGACRVHQELRPYERVVGVGEQRVDGGYPSQAAVVPFGDDWVFGAQYAAADAIQLVAVEHQLRVVKDESAENDKENGYEERGCCRKENGLFVQKIHVGKYKNTAGEYALRYGEKRRTCGSTALCTSWLVGGVFVDLVVLDEAVDAERRNHAYGDKYDNLDEFSHSGFLF